MLNLTKRQKFVITSALLSLGFIGINFLDNQYRFWAIGFLTALTVTLFFWSLIEGIGLDARLLTLVLPALFTLSIGLFFFLLPASIFVRLPVVIAFGVGIYALCLTTNIFTVSAIRTIALVRAAKGVGFVFTLLVLFFLYDTLFSLRLSIFPNTILILLATLPLILQGLWQSNLEKRVTKKLILHTVIITLSMSQVAVLLYFWPVTVIVGSIFLTIAAYVLLGLGQAFLEGRLFSQTVKEYLGIAMAVFITMLLVTHWGA